MCLKQPGHKLNPGLFAQSNLLCFGGFARKIRKIVHKEFKNASAFLPRRARRRSTMRRTAIDDTEGKENGII